jgi:hypothetical protein
MRFPRATIIVMASSAGYFAAYYRAHRALYIERAKARYRADPMAKHNYDRQRRKDMGDKLRAQAKAKRDRNRGTAWEIWNRAKWRAKRKGIQFTITVADVVVPTHCPALGIKLSAVTKKGGHYASPSLDRIDPSLGYVPGNVVVISKRANTIKADASAIELMMVVRWMDRLTSANLSFGNGKAP